MELRRPDFLLCVSRRMLWQILIVLAAFLLLLYAGRVVLIVVAGIFLAAILRGIANAVARWTPISARWSYAAVLWTILLAIGVSGWTLGPRVAAEVHDLGQTIPDAVRRIEANLNYSQSGQYVVHILHSITGGKELSAHALNEAKVAGEFVTDAIVIIAIALFLGSRPSSYRDGVLQLLPMRQRETVRLALDEVGKTVQSWLLGQLVPMAALGIGTFVGFSIMGIPLAFVLSLFTALMLFIPYAGSVIAFIPAVLVGLSNGTMGAVDVTILYLGVHVAEGYVITPLVQKKAVRLPPALTLASQLLMWKLAGILGVLVATPLAAACLALIQRLYLKRDPDTHG